MNLERAVERAHSVSGNKTAAGLYHDINYELATRVDNEDDYEHGEEALRVLKHRFPGVEREASNITRPPKLSRGGADRLADQADTASKELFKATQPAKHRAQKRLPNRTARQRLSSITVIHARPRSRRAPLFSSRVTGAAGDTGHLVIRSIEGMVALVLLGLLVSDRGSSAISSGSGLLAHFAGIVANPTVDPLRSAAPRQPASPAPSTTAPRPGPAVSPRPQPPGQPLVRPGARVPNLGGIGHRNIP